MYRYKCQDCTCSLDPGEGRLCDACIKKREQEQARRQAMDLLLTLDAEQMEMEELVNG